MVELNKILTGTLFTMIIVTGIVLFYNDGIHVYSPTGSDNVSIFSDTMNEQFDQLSNITNKTKVNMETLSNPEASIIDRVGAFLGNGLNTLQIGVKSFDIIDMMIGTSAEQIGAGGSFITTIRIMIPVGILIIFFVAIFLQALIKTDRI